MGTRAIDAAAKRRGCTAREAVGLFYSTQTGNTETVAGVIAEKAGVEAMDVGKSAQKILLATTCCLWVAQRGTRVPMSTAPAQHGTTFWMISRVSTLLASPWLSSAVATRKAMATISVMASRSCMRPLLLLVRRWWATWMLVDISMRSPRA